ncbi:uncharacterized protein LOC128389560 isoform X2 [Panonychus citri]|uniref:uncharacterized protein LOC128389560 isoform X2 n=1 Tax=Panonychus citri TaxID=50023 RepID=UPI00230788E3|nr:uncharacterized protein LOC128389560 isoform X2 [Panonychus citri]
MDSDIDRFLSDNQFFQDRISPTSSSKIFAVQVNFDFGQGHIYQTLNNQLIVEPIKALKTIQFKLCNGLRNLKKISLDSFSLLIFVPVDLPNIESAVIDSNRDLYLKSGPKINRLTKMKDFQIISMSDINSFKLASLYRCKCLKSRFYNYLIDGPPRKVVKCDCHNTMEETIKERVVVQRKSVLLRKTDNYNPRLSPILIHFMSTGDENYEKLRLGTHLSQIVGLSCSYEDKPGSWVRGLEVLNYQMSLDIQSASHDLNCFLIPENIETIVESFREISPFSLALKLCDLFAGELVGEGNFRLKMGPLIAILNQHGTECQEKSFLAVGSDAGTIRNLLQYSAKFVQRVASYSSTIPISAIPRKRDTWIDSGFLQLVSDGVGIISLDKVSVRDESQLISVLTQNLVKIKITDEKFDSVRDMETNIAIWAYETEDNIERRVKTKSSSLITTFALVYESESNTFAPKSSEITQEDWKIFFNSLSSYKPKLSTEAEEFLQNYFLAVRQDREWRADMQSFPLLLSVATVFAKLSCRNHVLTCDAVLAIIIFEKSLNTKFGSGGLSLSNLTKDKNRLIGPGAAEILERCRKNIVDYIENCGVGIVNNVSEE